MVLPPRMIHVWSVAADGARTAFEGTGLRVPLPDGAWVAIDLGLRARSLAVVLSARNRRPGVDPLPRLSIVPVAGGTARVLIGTKPGPETFDVVPVDRAELKGDMRDWLVKLTSGDPLGELVLDFPDRASTPEQRFVMQYHDRAEVHISLRPSKEALLAVDVEERDLQVGDKGQQIPALGMLVLLHAANTVTFLFKEVTATVE